MLSLRELATVRFGERFLEVILVSRKALHIPSGTDGSVMRMSGKRCAFF